MGKLVRGMGPPSSREWPRREGHNTSTLDYKEVKTLKPIFIIKFGDEAREIYHSKRKPDKLVKIIKFMSDHYQLKRTRLAYIAIFFRAKRREHESVDSYMVRLRRLATPCDFKARLEEELLRAFTFGCGIEKVEEMMCSDDTKTLKDAIACGQQQEH
jgi:hypothetical protein